MPPAKKQPTLHPCPNCGVELQMVGKKLAAHRCVVVDVATRMRLHADVMAMLVDAKLTPSKASNAITRLLLLRSFEGEANVKDLIDAAERLAALGQGDEEDDEDTMLG